MSVSSLKTAVQPNDTCTDTHVYTYIHVYIQADVHMQTGIHRT